MTTRCIITKKINDDKQRYMYKSIYCHSDGYPEGVGRTLNKHYKDPKKVDKLISLGDISSLGSIIGHKHKFSSRAYVKSTTAYHRDRGEPWKDVAPFYSKNKENLNNNVKHMGVDYHYVFVNGRWF